MWCWKPPPRSLTMRIIIMKFLTLLHFFGILKAPPSSSPFLFFTPLSLSYSPYPSFLIPPSSFLPLSPHHFIVAGIHSSQPLDGSKHLLICPTRFHPSTAWTLSCLLFILISTGIKIIRPLVNCSPSSHVCAPLVHNSMPPPCSDMLIYSAPDLGSGSPEAVRILLNVVAGVEGGRLLGISWQALPLTHSFVKERLALAAFSNCHCSFPSASWSSGSGFGIALTSLGGLR